MEQGRLSAYLRNPNNRAGLLLLGGTTGLSAFVLAVSGCGGGDTTTVTVEHPGTGGNTPGQTDGQSAHGNNADDQPQLTFDYLGHGSRVIKAYPSPDSGPDDYDATYYSGETVPADCKTTGPDVVSNPGEEPRESDEWFKFEGPDPQKDYFVPAIYTHNPHQLIMELPDC